MLNNLETRIPFKYKERTPGVAQGRLSQNRDISGKANKFCPAILKTLHSKFIVGITVPVMKQPIPEQQVLRSRINIKNRLSA
jgi:hypothetical protein